MRLTLRTLLAYLDDTLEAGEIKEIGEKVAESDAAQELVARLKQVTRRRRLTAPPSDGPEKTDPNEVAEYLDSELPPDRVAELEKLALESDVHLAEIAACHQILTLVLGDPIMVPPKSKERMYGLVRGREAIPNRKAQAPKQGLKDTMGDEEELALSSGWLRWVLPAAGGLLVALLALAVYQVLPATKPADPGGPVAKNGTKPGGPSDEKGEKVEKQPDGTGGGEVKGGNSGTAKVDEKPKTGNGGTGVGSTPIVKDEGKEKEKEPVVVRAPAPDTTRALVGNYAGGLTDQPTVLAYRQQDQEAWSRYAKGAGVYSNDTLTALPGFSSVVQSKNGVRLLLRGTVREFAMADFMLLQMDSSVILHPSKDFDLDFTFLRGRIYLTNRKDKGPATIRMRFEGEVWDVTLAGPGDEVCVDLTKAYTALINYRANEEPRAHCVLAVLQGEAEVKVDAFHTYTIDVDPPKWAYLDWDSFTRTKAPQKVPKMIPALAKFPPGPEQVPPERLKDIKAMQAAAKNLETLLGSNKTLEVALKETLEKPAPADRVLAIYCLAAIDNIGPVIEELGNQDPQHMHDREAAFTALQRWVWRGAKQSKVLYDEKANKGLLVDRKYKKGEAETFVDLLHPFQAQDMNKAETFEALGEWLRHRKVAIAEMAYWHLQWLSHGAKLPGGFNAAMPQEDRERYAGDIKKLIEAKKLPAPPPPEGK